MGRKNDPEVTEADRKAFMKSITTGSSSPEDARHLRGVFGLLVVMIVMLGGDVVLYWKLGGFDEGASAGNGARGVAYLLTVQVAFAAWVYRRLSARPSNTT